MSTRESSVGLLNNVVFFLDRSTGKQLAINLRLLGLNVETHDNHFPQNSLDVEWLTYCGELGWVVISSDRAIKSNTLEKRVLQESGVAAFFFTSANLTSDHQFEIFTKALSKIAKIVLSERRPFIARIAKDSTVELWLNHRGEDLIAKKQMPRRLKSR